MQVSFDPGLEKEILDRVKKKFNLNSNSREGLHLSDLTYCITRSYWKKQVGGVLTDNEVLLFAIGLALEKVLLEDETGDNRPEPVELDGILMSPDYILNGALAELKSTRIAFVKDALEPNKGWPQGWIKQMMGYSLAVKRGLVKGAVDAPYRLAILQVIQAQVKGRSFKFLEADLEQFWADVLVRRDALVEALEKKLPPEPFAYTDSGKSDDWQCTNCAYNALCPSIYSTGLYIKKGA